VALSRNRSENAWVSILIDNMEGGCGMRNLYLWFETLAERRGFVLRLLNIPRPSSTSATGFA
jgi:hypothetical protein